ncbi:hypothetical protein AX769_20490 [Frondihabitans sp. PAMC 28766]|uniref:glycosyl hydrolase family 18 protein n=1 Tax=Frondihabitans sp. PAMC 28766 TaxID=1795630 RepID=UPI00078D186C|nr:glycosyl hydrolase family 18 protein [Frondihabitans sp. PAMC 28766]AMM22088.1 hypothetical protein AX769_20490 [Frondihabitans sp. PAMC 28766]
MSLSRIAAAAAAAALLIGGLTAPTVAEAATADLVADPGFETGALSPWTCAGPGSVTKTAPHFGSYALTDAATSSDVSKCSQVVSVKPGSSYTLSGYVTGAYTILGDTGTGTTDGSIWASGSGWSNVTTSFSTGASTTSVTIYVSGWYGEGSYGADDISLTGPAGSSTPPASSATVPGAPTSVHSTATTSSSATIVWTAPSNTGTTSTGAAAPLSGYTIYRGGTKVGTATGTSYTDSGIAASTAYSYTVSASNATGASPQSSAASVTTTAAASGGTGGGTGTGTGGGTGAAAQLPEHLLTGYWQDFTNGAESLPLSAVPTSYNLVAVAFATSTSTPGAVTFSIDSGLSTALGGYTAAQFTSDIATLHSRGQKVILSVGGQDGTISVSDSASAAAFASSVESLMSTYGFDGVDIDLENGINPTYMGQALHAIAAAKPGAIITMAPQTIDVLSSTSDYLALALNIEDVLTIMNTQYYNSGSMNGCDGGVYSEGTVDFVTSLACTALQAGLKASQVGIGVPASTSAAGSGYVAPSVVNSSLTCLASGTGCGTFVPTAKYPTIRGAMDWSINWDASNGYAFADAVQAQLAKLP